MLTGKTPPKMERRPFVASLIEAEWVAEGLAMD